MGSESYSGYVKRRKVKGRKKKKKSGSKSQKRKNITEVYRYDEINQIIENEDSNISKEDLKKLKLGKEAWDKSMSLFHNPAIPDPSFVFDKTKFIGFFIDMYNWKTVLNLSNIPFLILDREILNYYHAMALHEISHYVICPYDLLTNARLVKSALKHVPEKLSPVVVNFFADLLVDMKLFRMKPHIMREELEQTLKMTLNIGKKKGEKEHSKMYKLLVKSYELMWDINLNLLETEYEEITPIAEKVKKIIMKNFEDFTKWEKKVASIAKLLKKIFEGDFQPRSSINQTKTDENGESKREWGDNLTAGDLDNSKKGIQVPLDIQATMGNPFEIKSKPKSRDMANNSKRRNNGEKEKNTAEILATEMNLRDFAKVNQIMKLVPQTQTIATYYRGISKNLIKIKILERKPSGSIPVGIEPWRVSDPIEKLDVMQTILVSPKIIPNITTRKWIMKDGPGIDLELGLPDLLLVLDSSGSMEWNPLSSRKINSNPYHLALVASFASLDYALKKGAKISAINFSDYVQSQTWTRNSKKIEKILLSYQGMGTNLPVDDIRAMCISATRKSLVILITDFEIFNWQYAYPEILKIIRMGNKIVGFFIGGNKNELKTKEFKEMASLGSVFYAINNINDLIGLVIKEIKDIYD